ncbi:MAG: AMP-binding protein [Rubrivivax sp.]
MDPADAAMYEQRVWQAHYGPDTPAELPASPHANLATLVRTASERYAAQRAFTAVVPNGMNGSLSFAQVDELSDAFAAYLREELGLAEGARVAVQLPNGLAYPVAVFGIFKAGCVLVNTNPLYTAPEMAHQFKDSGAQALVITELFADKLDALAGQTDVRHVIVASVPELFPAVPRGIVRAVQRWWNRALPRIHVPHVRFMAAIAKGRAHRERLGSASVRQWSAAVGGDATAVLQYTGGTTGVAKGARLSHRNLLANLAQIRAMGASQIEPGQECVLTALPLYHVFAFTANLLSFYDAGARNVLIPSPRPVQNLQRAIENTPITWVTGVNTLFNALLNEEWFVAFPPRRLKAAIAGGTALHPAVAERWEQVTGTRIVEGYGLTETSPVVTFNPLSGTRRVGSIGIPVPGTELRLLDDAGLAVAVGEPGEIAVRGPQVMQGYWNQPGETASVLRDGWLHTGDVAVMDTEGFFTIVDRKKDLILVSGFNVYPNEVEEAVSWLDAVMEAAVVGVPDARSSEAVRVYVVRRDESLTAEQVIAHCRTLLTDYKVPKSVVFRDELPKSPIGKILRKELKAQVRAEMQATTNAENA